MSIRFIFVLILLLTIGSVFAWVSGQIGSITIQIGDISQTVSLALGAATLLFITIFCVLILDVLRFIIKAPARWKQNRARKRELKGEEWLAQGFIALSADNPQGVKIAAKNATKLLPQSSPMLELLQAENLKYEGDLEEAEKLFTELLNVEETKARAARSLQDISNLQANKSKALNHTLLWQTSAPTSQSALLALMQSARDDQNYNEAEQALDRALGAGAINKKAYEKQRAALLTAQAVHLHTTHPAQSYKLAKEALKLDQNLAPAGLIAAQGLKEQADIKQGSKILEKIWQNNPNESIADLYIHMRDGDGTLEKLKRAQTLSKLVPDNPESTLCLAKAYFEHGELEKSKAHALTLNNDSRAQFILAQIAQLQQQDPQDIIEIYKDLSDQILSKQKSSVLKLSTPIAYQTNTQVKKNTVELAAPIDKEMKEPEAKKRKKKFSQVTQTIFPLSQAPDDPGVIEAQDEKNI